MNRLFILRERAHVDSLLTFLSLNWEAFAKTDRPLSARLAPYKKTRSNEQNALMWVWLTQIGVDAWVAGRRFDAETWNEHFKRECLPETCSKGVDKWRVLPIGERVLVMSTTDLNVDEMSVYMTAFSAMAAVEFGVTLT